MSSLKRKNTIRSLSKISNLIRSNGAILHRFLSNLVRSYEEFGIDAFIDLDLFFLSFSSFLLLFVFCEEWSARKTLQLSRSTTTNCSPSICPGSLMRVPPTFLTTMQPCRFFFRFGAGEEPVPLRSISAEAPATPATTHCKPLQRETGTSLKPQNASSVRIRQNRSRRHCSHRPAPRFHPPPHPRFQGLPGHSGLRRRWY